MSFKDVAYIVVFGLIILLGTVILDYRVDHYPVEKVDSSKMWQDKLENNLSDRDVQRNMVNGKYDK